MSDTGSKPPTNGKSTNGKSTNGDPAKGEEKVAPPAGERVGFGSGRMPSAGIPMEKSLNFCPSVKRLLRRMGPDRRLLGVVFVLAVIGVTLDSPGSITAVNRADATRILNWAFSRPR